MNPETLTETRTDVRWLDDREQSTWRRWLRANLLLGATLQRDMAQRSGLSLQDFEVLVLLTEEPEQRLRISKLAKGLQWEKSRLSHHLGRMIKRGLVAREECCSDGRGAFIAVTEEGRTAIEGAAPPHVELVREVFFESMSAAEESVLDEFLGKLLARLDDDPTPACR